MKKSHTQLNGLRVWLRPSLVGHRASRWLLVLACCGAICLPVAGAELAEALARPALTPGQENRIDDPQTGGLGYWTIYLPADYTEARAWPVIFSFHGLNQKPGVWPFAEVLQRKGFIIVGMEYLQRGLEGIDRALEAENLERVVALVSDWLAVDEDRRFIGGFSKGGWHASNVGERSADLWAGVVILGAGRSASGDPSGLVDKPVFIGIGEQDIERSSARAAANFYQELGASVTFVTYEGLGHTVDLGNPALNHWLNANPAVAVAQGESSSAGDHGG